MAIGKIKASRVNNVDAPTYVGEAGILFYNFANGVIRLSDGITSGGVPVPYTIASNTVIGGIKAGPGIVISNEGELFIDSANLAFSFGNFTADNNVLTIVNTDEDMYLRSSGNANINLIGGVHFYKPNGFPPDEEPFFRVKSDGQLRILVPVEDPFEGGIEIIGSASGNYITPGAPGTMLQMTGNPNLAVRMYMDGVGNYASIVGRRYNGNVASPTQVLINQDVLRINATGATDAGVGNVAMAQIQFRALENQTTTAQGSTINFIVTPVGSPATSRVEVANITVANGVTATKFTTLGSVTATGNVTGGNLTTNGTILATGNISGGNLLLSTGGLISSSGLISTTANISGGNIATSGSINVTGNIIAGNVNSYITLPAGTTTVSPLMFTAGNILTVPDAGSLNYDGRIFYGTPQGQERGLIKTVQTYVANSNYALIDQSGAQSMFGVNVAVSDNTRYSYTINAVIYKSSNNINMSYASGGSVILARHSYQTTTTASSTLAILSTPSVLKNIISTGFDTPVIVTGSLNGVGYYSIQITGVINVTTGGTWNPVIAFSELPGAGSYLAVGSSIEIHPLGLGNATVSIGNWS